MPTPAPADLDVVRAVAVPPVAPEIIDAEARLRRAQLDGDVGALDGLIADPLLFTGPDGALATKAQDLAAHASGTVKFREHTPELLAMQRVEPAVVIAAMRTRLAVEVGGSLVRGTYGYTRVWVRQADGIWRIAGGQVSEIRAP